MLEKATPQCVKNAITTVCTEDTTHVSCWEHLEEIVTRAVVLRQELSTGNREESDHAATGEPVDLSRLVNAHLNPSSCTGRKRTKNHIARHGRGSWATLPHGFGERGV